MKIVVKVFLFLTMCGISVFFGWSCGTAIVAMARLLGL